MKLVRQLMANWRILLPALALVVLVACSPLRVINNLTSSDHFSRATNVAYGDEERQTLDIYMPRAADEPAPVVIFFYGGGWRDGAKQDYAFVAASLTEAGYAVVIPDYRLFPDVVFPTFVRDGALAVSWVVRNIDAYSADPDRVFLMGHSAGAHIAAMLSLDGRFLAARGIDGGVIRGLVGLSGPYDFLPIESGYLLDVFPEDTRSASQPVNFVTAAAPPTLLIHGSDDEVVNVANSECLAAKLEQHGVDVTLERYEGAGHGTIAVALAPVLDFTAATLEDSREFLDGLSAPPAAK